MSGETELTEREIEVIRAFKDGSTYEEVAKRLGIARRTVTQHNYNSFKKIGARNIREAINYIDTIYGE